MAQDGEWSRLNNQGQAFLRVYTFSPGCTLISVGTMVQGEEWSRFRKHDSYSSLLEENSPDISLFYFEGRYSFRSHRCEWKICPDDSVYIITLFMCKLISVDIITMESVSLHTVEVCYCGGYVPLFVSMYHELSSCVLLWINTVVFYQLTLVPIVMEII